MHNPLVFITGINGFVGRNLQPYLAQDFEVVGISRKGKIKQTTWTLTWTLCPSYTLSNLNFATKTVIHLTLCPKNFKTPFTLIQYFIIFAFTL
jgi:nucleoside-diphosphate-sugar epimerase